MTLTRLGHAPGSQNERDWHNALSGAFTAVHGMVCATCGLDGVGHAPSSKWLGCAPHAFQGVPATPAMLTRANDLSRAALKAKREQGTHFVCGHRYASPACKTNCPHVNGHCGNCD